MHRQDSTNHHHLCQGNPSGRLQSLDQLRFLVEMGKHQRLCLMDCPLDHHHLGHAIGLDLLAKHPLYHPDWRASTVWDRTSHLHRNLGSPIDRTSRVQRWSCIHHHGRQGAMLDHRNIPCYLQSRHCRYHATVKHRPRRHQQTLVGAQSNHRLDRNIHPCRHHDNRVCRNEISSHFQLLLRWSSYRHRLQIQ